MTDKKNTTSSSSSTSGKDGKPYVYPGTDIIQTDHHSNQDVPPGSTTKPKAMLQYEASGSSTTKYPNPVGERIPGTDIVQTDYSPNSKRKDGKGETKK